MTEFLLTCAYALLFSLLIYRIGFFRLSAVPRLWMTAAFLLKVLAGLLLYVIYSRYYTDRATADIFRYFDDSRIMYEALFSQPLDYFKMLTGIGNDTPHFNTYYHQMNNWYRVYESNLYNDSHTIIRFNAFVRLFSFGYYNVHTVFMCFVSFTGLTAMYRFFREYIPEQAHLLFVAVFLIPSVLFWGSGVLKEGLLLFGMGFFLFSFRKILGKQKIMLNLMLLAVSVTVLLYTKFYIFIILIPLTVAFAWCHFRPRRVLLKYIAVLIVFVCIGLNLHYLLPPFDFMSILIQKQHDFISLARETGSGSMVHMEPLQPGFFHLLSRLPEAFFLTFFRPWIFEIKSLIMVMPAIENTLLIILLFISFRYFRKPSEPNFFWFAMFFFFLTFTLTGLTTPVMGAIVRYKVPALPFLFSLLVLITNTSAVSRALRSIARQRR